MRVLQSRRSLTATLACAAIALGCSSSGDPLKKQVKALQTKVTELRADADRLEERLQAMELQTAVAQRAEAKESRTGERPRLKVIHLSPDEAPPAEPSPGPEATEEPDEAGKRPVIRGTGDRVIKTGDASPSGRLTSPRSGVLALQFAPRGVLEN